jgi:hypothetical protein
MLVNVFAKQFMSYLESILDVINLCRIQFENAFLPDHFSDSVLHGPHSLPTFRKAAQRRSRSPHLTVMRPFFLTFFIFAREKNHEEC